MFLAKANDRLRVPLLRTGDAGEGGGDNIRKPGHRKFETSINQVKMESIDMYRSGIRSQLVLKLESFHPEGGIDSSETG